MLIFDVRLHVLDISTICIDLVEFTEHYIICSWHVVDLERTYANRMTCLIL